MNSAMLLAREELPELAIVDLSMPGDSGLVLISPLKALEPHIRIVYLTGYASIAPAVEAIMLGAMHSLPKPADADDILQRKVSKRPVKDQGRQAVPELHLASTLL